MRRINLVAWVFAVTVPAHILFAFLCVCESEIAKSFAADLYLGLDEHIFDLDLDSNLTYLSKLLSLAQRRQETWEDRGLLSPAAAENCTEQLFQSDFWCGRDQQFELLDGGDSKQCIKIFNSRPRSWQRAQRFCGDLVPGGHVLVIHNSEFNKAVTDRLQNETIERYWLGIARKYPSTQWMVGNVSAPYTRFGNLVPTERSQRAVCGVVRPQDVKLRWNFDKCSSRLPFICQKNLTRHHEAFKRKIEVQHSPQTFDLWPGQRIKVQCIYVFPRELSMELRFTYSDKSIVRIFSVDSLVQLGRYNVVSRIVGKEYESNGDRTLCLQKNVITFTLKVALEMNSAETRCCVDRHCAKLPQKFKVSYPKRPPNMTTEVHHIRRQQYHSSICTADVGTLGTLTWILAVNGQMYGWVCDVKGELKTTGNVLEDWESNMDIVSRVTHDEITGPRITSRIKVYLSRITKRDNHGTLACFSYNIIDFSSINITDINDEYGVATALDASDHVANAIGLLPFFIIVAYVGFPILFIILLLVMAFIYMSTQSAPFDLYLDVDSEESSSAEGSTEETPDSGGTAVSAPEEKSRFSKALANAAEGGRASGPRGRTSGRSGVGWDSHNSNGRASNNPNGRASRKAGSGRSSRGTYKMSTNLDKGKISYDTTSSSNTTE